jgi:hypothetical protein
MIGVRIDERAVVDCWFIAGHRQLIIDTSNACARRGLAGDCIVKA